MRIPWQGFQFAAYVYYTQKFQREKISAKKFAKYYSTKILSLPKIFLAEIFVFENL